MMRVADYIASRLADWGVRHLWMITGGGAMHLNDAIGRETRIEYVCCHHEQACAMAAESYAKLTGRPGVINVTTGPGGINTLNGVFGAWTDSNPLLIVSGQVKLETCLANYDWPGRQLGDQEADMVRMVEAITKYAVVVRDPKTIRYHLERAWHLVQSGRPGPCWLDVPVDIQGAPIEPDELIGYDPNEDAPPCDQSKIETQVRAVLEKLDKAERPIILAGHGVRVAGARDELLRFAEGLQIPVAAAWDACDLIANDHPCYAGRPGTVGERAGNFAVQNADVVLVIGCRLNIRQVSYAWKQFARAAHIIQVDIDPLELDKPTVRPDDGICCDAKYFVSECLRQIGTLPRRTHQDYLQWCRERVRRFGVVRDEQRARQDGVSGYAFVEALCESLDENDVIVTANGAASVMLMQAARVQNGQRLIANSGSASMGYDLPAAIGACFGHDKKRVMCLAGDGSIMMNLQELQTIVHHQLPVKIFVWNNGLYLSIRTTQQNFFGGNLVGESPVSGVSCPDYVKLAQAFGIASQRIENLAQLNEALPKVLCAPGPSLCEIIMPSDELMLPKTSSLRLPDDRMVSKPLEDMFPFLERDEFAQNMLIAHLEE